MDLSRQIIAEVDKGTSESRIASDYPWDELSPVVREGLFQEVERRSENGENPLPLLRALYRLTSRHDAWAMIRVLFAVYRIDREKREDILDTVREKLSSIRESLKRGEASRYLHYRAEYYVLKAHTEIDTGDLVAAIGCYEQALKSYEKAVSEGSESSSDRIASVQRDLDRLRAIQARNQHLVVREDLESKSLQLQQQISDSDEELKAIRTEVENETARRERLAQRCDGLRQEIEEYEAQERNLESLKEEVRQHEAALQFLTVLPQAAIAPLWVEVVRLALEQGEIDSLVEQAVERLVPEFPEEAVPLLSEIAARTPGGLSVDEDAYQACTSHWMGKIAEARRLRKEEGIRAAAETLVEAWDAYFAALEGGSE